MSINITDKPEMNVVNVGDELTQDQLDAITSAATPTSANPFATMADVSGGGSPTVVNLIGMSGMYSAVLGDRIFIFDSNSTIDVTALYAEPAGTELTFINQDGASGTTINSASSGFYQASASFFSITIPAKAVIKAVSGSDTYFYVI